jgi:uncharacterized repeat protein (TIGR01451 family)
MSRMALLSGRRVCALALILLLPVTATTAAAQSYIYTGQSGAQTQIDVNHTSSWYVQVSAGNTMTLGGGKFHMKKGPTATGSVTLTLYANGPGGTQLATVTLGVANFGSSFAETVFNFSSAPVLSAGTYYASLTSNAVDNQNQAFFIKGATNAIISQDGVTPVSGGGTTAAPEAANFSLAKSASATAMVSGTITYTIGLGNDGGSPSGTSFTVRDQLPTGVVATAVTAGAGVSSVSCGALPSGAGALLTCSGTLSSAIAASSATGSASFTITATAPVSTGTITNYASVDGSGGNSPPTPGTSCTSTSCGSASTTVIAPDLTIGMSHSGNFTQGQTGATYTVTVTNSGNATSSGTVTVSSTMPASLTPTAGSGTGWSCVIAGQNITCTRSDALASGSSYPALTFTVTVASNAPASVTPSVSVSGGGEVNTSNNSASDPTTIGGGPDLTIAKSHTGSFTTGQTGATYTLTITNAGGTATSGQVTVTDAVPNGLTPTAASGGGWSCSISGQNVSCTRSDALAVSQSYSAITLTVDVASNASSVTNTASVGGGGDVNSGNNSASDPTTIVTGPDLTIAVTHTGSFQQGQTGATYTITVGNSGGTASSGLVTISHTAPAGFTPTAASGTGWTCTVTGQDVSCTRSDALAASQSYPAVTVTVNVANNATNATATATVSGGNDSNNANNSASDPITVGAGPDLIISKTHTGNFLQGQTGATYTLTVSNTGQSPSSGAITVSDAVPAGLTPTSASGTGWSCTITGQNVSCTRNDALAAGQSLPVITLTVDVAANASNVTNTATVAGGGDVNGANNSASDATTIVSGPDLTITVAHVGNFQQGQTGATYTITVGNSGATASSGLVTVSHTAPAGLTPTAASGTGWSCSVSGQNVTCTRSDALATGQSYPAVTVTVNVANNASSVTAIATVSGGSDAVTSNNSASDPITVIGGPDLVLTKSHTGNFVRGQIGAAYAITVSNSGGSASSGLVTMSDTVPAGLTPTAANGSGWACTITGQNVTCTRNDALAASQSFPAITLTVDVAANAASVTNTATVAGGGDVNTGNNTASDLTTIVTGPDLSIAKSHSGNFLQGQTGASYVVTVSNAGQTATAGVVTVTDTLPNGLTPTGAVGLGWTCTVGGQQVTCTRGDALAGSQSYPVLTIVANVAADATNVTNTVSVSGGGDSNAANNTATDPTIITAPAPPPGPSASPDLAVAIARHNTFTGGGEGTYLITVTNRGAGASTGTATLAHRVSSGLTPTAATGAGWTCTIAGQDVACTRSDQLPSGQSYPPVTLLVSIAVNASSASIVATISAAGDADGANNTATDATTIAGGPDLTITKTHAGAFVRGQSGVYTIVVSNVGGSATTGTVTIVDPLPAGLSAAGTSALGWACTISGPNVSCTRSDALSPGQSYPPVRLSVNIAPSAVDVVNTATVAGGGDVNAGNNSASDPTAFEIAPDVGAPDLTMAKTHSGTFAQGQTGATYTLTVSNRGTRATSGPITVTDNVPRGLTPVAAAGPGWSCTLDGQSMRCSRSDALPGGAAFPPIVLTVNIAADATSVTNTAVVSGGGDDSPANNVASDPTTIAAVRSDLTIDKRHAGKFVRGQRDATYTLTVRNEGPGASTGPVTVTELPPAGLQVIAMAGPGWSCAGTTCDRSDALAANGAFPPITVTVAIDLHAATTLTNTASVSGDSDGNPTNNTASDVTEISDFTAADFQIAKTVDRSVLQPGDTVRFTLEARNHSAAAVTGVRLTETLPRGFSYVRGTARVTVWVDGAPLGDAGVMEPEVLGNSLTFDVGTLPAGAVASIQYDSLLDLAVRSGRQDIELYGWSLSPLGERIAAVPVQLALIVSPSTFAAGQLVIGRVFHDADNDGQYDDDERGIPGVRVIVPSGLSAVTDTRGLYNIPALAAGTTVVAVDPASLPPGYRVRRAGVADGSAALLRTPLGSGALLRQNFAVLADPGAAPLPHETSSRTRQTSGAQARGGERHDRVIERLTLTTAAPSLAADGRTRTAIVVRAEDADGAPASGPLRVHTTAGQLLTWAAAGRPADPCSTSESGTEAPQGFADAALDAYDGEATACLVSDVHPGVATITATVEGRPGVRSTTRVTLTPVDRAPLIVAVGEVAYGAETTTDEGTKDTLRTHGQVFFQDTLGSSNQVTIALNSKGPIHGGGAERLFHIDPLDRAYPVLGDASTRQELAQSNARVYARLDHARSHVMFGDLRLDPSLGSGTGLGEIARNLVGFRAHVAPADRHAVTVTASRPDTAFRREILSGGQLGALRLSRAPVLPGSETVTLEVRDRRNPEIVMRREVLARSIDYLLDPITGVLYLKRPVQWFDEALNLTNLVVTYEHQVAGFEAAAYSARLINAIGSLQVRTSAFVQERAGTRFVLGSIHAEQALFNGGRVVVEVPVSHGAAESLANIASAPRMRTAAAWSIVAEQPFTRARTTIRAHLQGVERDFNNPFGSPGVSGTRLLAASLETHPLRSSTWLLSARHERNDSALADNQRLTIGTRWDQEIGFGLRIGAGLDHRRLDDRRSHSEIDSYLVTAEAQWRADDRIGASVRREQNLATTDRTYPDQTVLSGSVKVSPRSRVFATQRFSDAPIVPLSGGQFSELLSPLSTRETAVGVQSSISRYTDVTSKFQIDRGINGTDAFALVGARTRVPVRGGFGIDVGFDRGERLQGGGSAYTSGTIGLAYTSDDRARGSVHYELRSREHTAHVLSAGLAGRVAPGVTALANYRVADLNPAPALVRDVQALAAIAVRPERSDRAGLLFSWAYGDRHAGVLPGHAASRTARLSTDGYVAPLSGLELHSRLALISTSRPDIATRVDAYLWQGRAQQRLWSRLDVAVEGRTAWQNDFAARHSMTAAELGLWLLSDVRVGVGYRTRPIDANGLPVLDVTTRGGAYFVLTSRLAGFFNLLGSPGKAAMPSEQ